MDELAELAAEGEQDGHDSCAADNPGAVYFGDGHNADVFAISGVRRCACKTADDVGKAVGEQGTGETWIFDEVALDDVAGDDKVADVFGKYNKSSRSNNHNRADIKDGGIEMRNLEPGRVDNRLEVDHAHNGGEYITADNAEENRDDAQKAAESNGTDDADSQCEHGYGDIGGVDVVASEACHIGRNRSKLEADDSDNCAHRSRREDNINPFCANIMDDDGEQHENQAEDNEAGLRVVIAGLRHD